MEFTLDSYLKILNSGLKAGYNPMRVVDLFELETGAQNARLSFLVLRHDVDRKPKNALAMAQAEARLGVCSTYYFRTVGSAYNVAIISQIADLGHEIGYHYEDFHVARYDVDKAFALFQKNIEQLRKITEIRTIAMHGSPLSRFNNMELWKHKSFEGCGVADCILSHDWSDTVFLTDTGRCFDAQSTNMRDQIGGLNAANVSSCKDLVEYLKAKGHHKIQLSTHPERWDDNHFSWVVQRSKDKVVNGVKRVLNKFRNGDQ